MIRMRVRPGRARHGAIAASAAGLLCLTSGCTGFLSSSMTETVDNAALGSNTQVGSMLVRNAFVLGPSPDAVIPEGGKAAVYLTLYNQASVDQPGEPASAGATDRLIGASAGETARSVRISGGSIAAPPSQRVNVTLGSERMVLRGLTRPLSGGESIELTLRFQRAGNVTFSVPVLPRTEPYATLSPFPDGPPPRSATPSP